MEERGVDRHSQAAAAQPRWTAAKLVKTAAKMIGVEIIRGVRKSRLVLAGIAGRDSRIRLRSGKIRI